MTWSPRASHPQLNYTLIELFSGVGQARRECTEKSAALVMDGWIARACACLTYPSARHQNTHVHYIRAPHHWSAPPLQRRRRLSVRRRRRTVCVHFARPFIYVHSRSSNERVWERVITPVAALRKHFRGVVEIDEIFWLNISKHKISAPQKRYVIVCNIARGLAYNKNCYSWFCFTKSVYFLFKNLFLLKSSETKGKGKFSFNCIYN